MSVYIVEYLQIKLDTGRHSLELSYTWATVSTMYLHFSVFHQKFYFSPHMEMSRLRSGWPVLWITATDPSSKEVITEICFHCMSKMFSRVSNTNAVVFW